MSRHEKDFQPGEAVDAASVLASFMGRQQALVCLLAAADGWREASQKLDGAFAEEPQAETGLKPAKEE